ncbi:MAG: RHS repeat-associated core domain-containing protein, partial [Bryobacteraceae bacterium]
LTGAAKTYAQNITYFPTGAWQSMDVGSAPITRTRVFNPRLQLTSETATAPSMPSIMNFSYCYTSPCTSPYGGNNGNLWSYSDNAQGLSYAFDYDPLNRLTSALETTTHSWGNTYTYDAWGNLTSKNQVDGYNEHEPFNNLADVTNRLTGWHYDNAGNLLNDVFHSYVYNAESQITSVDGTGATYVYSTEGERVKRTVGTTVSEYIGSPILETLQATNVWQEDYIYLNGTGGDLIATESAADGTRYLFADNLGTPRVITYPSGGVITDGNGHEIGRHDYYPFGTEVNPSSDDETHKFTGKERDAETGLDYFGARYYGSTMGRWMSPDWAENPTAVPYSSLSDPQTLNLYGYMRNNPLSGTDPDGHCGEQQQGGGSGCPNVNVTATVNGQRTASQAIEHHAPPSPNLVKVGSIVTIKVTDSSGKPIAGASIQEHPTTVNNLTGKSSSDVANPNAVKTLADGTRPDQVATNVVAEGQATDQEIKDHVNAQPFDKTTTQNLTITTTGSNGQICTCSATYTEHVTNVSNGQLAAPNATTGVNRTLTISPVKVTPNKPEQ